MWNDSLIEYPKVDATGCCLRFSETSFFFLMVLEFAFLHLSLWNEVVLEKRRKKIYKKKAI